MALSDLTSDAVNAALDEFDSLGREAFLERYGFGPARGYFLVRDGRRYDSKAVVGAAHGKLPGRSALGARDFVGGETTVGRLLSRLGFTVVGPSGSDRDAAIALVDGQHVRALRWFRDHASQVLPWQEIRGHAEHGPRLVNQAKGIYKPEYTDYALSVRQTLGGPYADGEVERRADGSWRYEYFQENPNPAQRDREATNRGLMKCMEDGVPVGVLLQTKGKPGVEYEVLGLALVTDWQNGYFTLEGFAADGSHRAAQASPAERARERVEEIVQQEGNFDPLASAEDQREKAIAEVVRRRGQRAFRAAVIEAYGACCAITGCDAVEALEAAHISPYRGDGSNHVQNGLLLRADVHSLFDLGLIAIDPDEMTIRLAPALQRTTFSELDGKRLIEPSSDGLRPSRESLRQHLRWSGL